MSVKPWHELIKSEPEAIIFLYLLFKGPNYGYKIAKTFQNAISEGLWDDIRGRGALKEPNVMGSILKKMAENGIIIPIKDTSRRSYYDINIDVLSSPIKIEDSDKTPNYNPELSIIEYNGAQFEISDKERLITSINLIRNSEADEAKLLEYLNKITKFDYLTILCIFNELLTQFSLFLSPCIYNSSDFDYHFDCVGLTEDEIKNKISVHYEQIKNDMDHIIEIEMNCVKINLESSIERRSWLMEFLNEFGFNENSIHIAINMMDFHFEQLSETFDKTISRLAYNERGIKTWRSYAVCNPNHYLNISEPP